MADICKEIGIPDVNKEEVTKDATRNRVPVAKLLNGCKITI